MEYLLYLTILTWEHFGSAPYYNNGSHFWMCKVSGVKTASHPSKVWKAFSAVCILSVLLLA